MKGTKKIVIDADVLRRASRKKHNIDSLRCMILLNSIYRICHNLVVSGVIDKQYDEHASNYSTGWIAKMKRRDKLFESSNFIDIENIRDEIVYSEIFVKEEISKIDEDIHLIQAALGADGIIVSCDDKIRRKFARAAQEIDEVGKKIGQIIWVNPVKENIDANQWIGKFKQHIDDYRLKNYPL